MTTSHRDTCPSCGADRRGLPFCPHCGKGGQTAPATRRAGPRKRAVAIAAPAIPAAVVPGPAVLVGLVQLTIVCAAASFLFWEPLAAVPRTINAALSSGAQTSASPLYQVCPGLPPGTVAMFACSAGIGLAALAAGPLIVGAAMFLFRRQLTAVLKAAVGRLPISWRHLGAPLIATVVFVVGWAGVHYETADEVGFVPHRLFPVVIGVFTYLSTRYTAPLQRSLRGVLTARDILLGRMRILLALLVPMVLGTLITSSMADADGRITNQAFTEQLVVVVSLIAGFIVMLPRDGSLLAGARAALTRGGR